MVTTGEGSINLGVRSGVVVPLISAVEGETNESDKTTIVVLNHGVGNPRAGWAHGETSPGSVVVTKGGVLGVVLSGPPVFVAVDVLESIDTGVIGGSVVVWGLFGMEVITADEVFTGGIVSPS